jgi:hypothetical protein
MLNELRFQENIELKFRMTAAAYIGSLAMTFGDQLLW